MTELRLYTAEEGVDRDGYPLPWSKGEPPIKDLVREIAGHRCVRCGHPYPKGGGEWTPCDMECSHQGPVRLRDPQDEDGWIFIDRWPQDDFYTEAGLWVWADAELEARWRILTVHHLTGDKLDCRWWNLAALCQRCHLTIQGKVKMERRWLHEHSDWFRPYVAGYYAATYLGEDLTREETLPRVDELLGLEMRQEVLA